MLEESPQCDRNLNVLSTLVSQDGKVRWGQLSDKQSCEADGDEQGIT